MFWLLQLLRIAAVVSALSALSSHAATKVDAAERPSVSQIRQIEEQVKLPDGAASLAEYVRYYYISASEPGVIIGLYVERRYVAPSEIPKDGIAVVESDADVPAPWDAGCSVVTVTYDVNDNAIIEARCDSVLFPEGSRSKERIPLALLLGALIVWFAWPSRGPRTHLRRIPPWNVAIVCAYWMWFSVEAVLTQSTGCAWFDEFSWSCWDYSIADTYIWFSLAGALFISALTALFGSRIGRIALLTSIVALVCWLLVDSIWVIRIYPYSEYAPLELFKEWLAHFDPVRLLFLAIVLGLSVWAVLRRNARVFYVKSA